MAISGMNVSLEMKEAVELNRLIDKHYSILNELEKNLKDILHVKMDIQMKLAPSLANTENFI